MDRTLVGRCGLYCGACTIYRAQRDSPELRKWLAEKFKCTPEQVQCNGCGALTPDSWGHDCKFVVCLRGKGYQSCYECSDYQDRTCKKFEEFAQEYLEEGVDLRGNLNQIKEGNIDQFLENSQKQYTCAFCGGPLAVGSKKCHHCGREFT